MRHNTNEPNTDSLRTMPGLAHCVDATWQAPRFAGNDEEDGSGEFDALDPDDEMWDDFLVDDEMDPQPEPGDFWPADD